MRSNDLEFRASWRSALGTTVIFLICFAAYMLLRTFFARTGGLNWGFLVGFLFIVWIDWLIGRQFFSRSPVVSVGPQGIGGYFLKDHTVPWAEVVDVSLVTVQGTTQLVIRMAPGSPALARTARWLSGKKPERSIALTALRLDDQKRAVDVVLKAFATYGGDKARAAVEAQLADTAAVEAFEDRLRALTPSTWALYLVVALNVGVWLANVAAGMSILNPSPAELFQWGANSASAVVNEQQYWRLLTGAFLHAGLLHLGLNMLGLWAAGKLLNRLFGNVQFLLIYLASAFAGSALSLHFSAQNAVAVGASGAVFGVLGALLVAIRKHRHTLPKSTTKSVLASQGVFLVYALLQGFTRAGTDNAAHVGGLVIGAIMAWLLVERVEDRSTEGRRKRGQALALGVVCVFTAVLVFSTPLPQLNHRQLFEVQDALSSLQPKMLAAERALVADAAANKGSRITDLQMVDAMKKRHIPAYREINQTLVSLKLSERDPAASALLDVQQLTGLTLEMMELEIQKEGVGADGVALDRQIAAIAEKLKVVAGRVNARGTKKAPA